MLTRDGLSGGVCATPYGQRRHPTQSARAVMCLCACRPLRQGSATRRSLGVQSLCATGQVVVAVDRREGPPRKPWRARCEEWRRRSRARNQSEVALLAPPVVERASSGFFPIVFP